MQCLVHTQLNSVGARCQCQQDTCWRRAGCLSLHVFSYSEVVVVIQHCQRVLAAWKEKRELTHYEFVEEGSMDDIVRISVELSLIVGKGCN
jgi:hypothetical protein